MLSDVFDELCYAGSNEVDDVDDTALFSRLTLLGALCSYLQPQSPLTADWIRQVCTKARFSRFSVWRSAGLSAV